MSYAARVQWLFTTLVLREQEESEDLILMTTERDMMIPIRYDVLYEPQRGRGRTLQYLDGMSATRVTFRSLYMVHGPHTFKGHKLTRLLRDVQIFRHSGGFVDAGEHELWEASGADLKARESQLPAVIPISAGSYRHQKLPSLDEKLVAAPEAKVGMCIFCGQQMTDYWLYEGKTKTCRCRSCRAKGYQ